MALSTTIYNVFMKRNAVFVSTIFLGAFGFGIGFDVATSAWWDKHNKGKQWKDLRDKYVEQA